MKRSLIYISTLLTIATLIGCKTKDHHVELTEAQKLEVLDMKLQKHPDDDQLLAERSLTLLNLGRTKEALFDINRAVSLKPKEVKYRIQQADACLANGDIDDSYNALTEAERLEPDNMEVQLKMGEITYYAGDFDRSLKSLSRVTEQEPDNRTALFMKSFIYKEKGDTASAVTLLRKVCDLYPDYAPAFEELGILYSARGNSMAVEYLTTAMRLEPNNTNAIYALAMFYQEKQEYDNAETLYRQMLDINPNSADAWHNLGYMELFYYRDYPRAIEYMTRALAADPNDLNSLVDRGCAYELSNQRDSARADFNAALSIDNTYQPAIDGLSRVK